MDMQTTITGLAEEAERQIRDRVWELTPDDRGLAVQVEAGLREAVGPPDAQEVLPEKDRLEHLREVLAVLAIALASTHGRLAWFLSGAITALEPVLHWRALPAADEHAFGTVPPTPEHYTEAEDAVRRLQTTLARITVS
ncbi:MULTISPECIES: hypothetical protein [Kitasatospora]|uniref:Uncharacterized protein n=1 Tax=Kitasatospora cathayae TaxID=3004092 RepID=A0ABY7QEV7_9ACTN|nr:hypothetical protein [Kitasatospora sp. HUAS 3-15]WBP91253.1 hypothetical protein O1G21_38820 [Kitasatospora sp. HUAS 3-15]